MRKRILAIPLAAVVLVLLASQALALSPGLEEAAPGAAALVTDSTADGFGLFGGVQTLLRSSLAELQEHLFSGIKSIAAIMAGVVLLGAVESAAPAGKDTINKYVSITGALWVTAVSSGDLTSLIGMGQKTIQDMSLLSKALLPALAAAEAASGGVTSAAVKQTAAAFFASLLMHMIECLLMPMVYLYIGTAAAGAVLEGEVLDRIGALLKKAVGWILSGLLVLFTTYLTISGAIAGAADAQTVRLTKSAVSAAIPVVGGILSDAAETVLAGAGLLRGMVGSFGTLAILGCCLLPVLRLGCQYMLYQGATLVAAAAGPRKLSRLLGMLADAFGLTLAMTAASAALLMIAVISSMTAAAPW